jgi:hypothetical protein
MARDDLEFDLPTLSEMAAVTDGLVRLKIALGRKWGQEDGVVLTLYGAAMLLQELYDNGSTAEQRATIFQESQKRGWPPISARRTEAGDDRP